MAQSQTPQDKADALIANFLPQFITLQNQFLTDNGYYYQGIMTPVVVPPNGDNATVDKTVKPTDQAQDWTYFGNTIPNILSCSIEIAFHNGPLGKGWTFYAWITDAQGTWKRAQGSGPDSVTFPWMLMKTLPA